MQVQQENLILQTAVDLFVTHGFKSVTMDDIAHQLGMSKKTLYTQYKNKASLVHAAALHLSSTMCSGVDRIIEGEQVNPIEELYTVKRYVMRELKGDNTSAIFQLQKYYPKVYREVTEVQYNFMNKCIAKNVQKGMALGLYRSNINPSFIARMYFIGIRGIKDLSIFPATEFPVHVLHDEYLEYHLRGIVTPQGRKVLNRIINSNHD